LRPNSATCRNASAGRGEAQASGIPVLGSNIAGIPNMVGGGGNLIDVNAPHDE